MTASVGSTGGAARLSDLRDLARIESQPRPTERVAATAMYRGEEVEVLERGYARRPGYAVDDIPIARIRSRRSGLRVVFAHGLTEVRR